MTKISTILARKGTDVMTIQPDATIADVVHKLAEHNLGVLVVSRDGHSIEGIISERDVVRHLAGSGAECLNLRVVDAMSAQVITCERTATVDEVMGEMTQRRVRHIPVVEGSELTGLVSIGDVVKSRIDELEVQAEALEHYVSGTTQ